jgi:hypothetical protein
MGIPVKVSHAAQNQSGISRGHLSFDEQGRQK